MRGGKKDGFQAEKESTDKAAMNVAAKTAKQMAKAVARNHD